MPIDKKQPDHSNNSTVLIFPAQTPMLQDKEICFIFSIRQVISVLGCHHTPSDRRHSSRIHGAAQFRGKEMPVLSLESCLGLPLSKSITAQRIIVIREVFKDDDHEFQDVYALCKLSAEIRRLKLPLECHPVAAADIFPRSALIKGAFEMGKSILLVIELRRILERLTEPVEEAVCSD